MMYYIMEPLMDKTFSKASNIFYRHRLPKAVFFTSSITSPYQPVAYDLRACFASALRILILLLLPIPKFRI